MAPGKKIILKVQIKTKIITKHKTLMPMPFQQNSYDQSIYSKHIKINTLAVHLSYVSAARLHACTTMTSFRPQGVYMMDLSE